MNILLHIERHKLATEVLDEIVDLKAKIKALQDKAILAEKDPTMIRSIKDLHAEHYQKIIGEYQELISSYQDKYKDILQKLLN